MGGAILTAPSQILQIIEVLVTILLGVFLIRSYRKIVLIEYVEIVGKDIFVKFKFQDKTKLVVISNLSILEGYSGKGFFGSPDRLVITHSNGVLTLPIFYVEKREQFMNELEKATGKQIENKELLK